MSVSMNEKQGPLRGWYHTYNNIVNTYPNDESNDVLFIIFFNDVIVGITGITISDQNHNFR